MSKQKITTNNRKRSELTRGEISVLIKDMEHHSEPEFQMSQIPRFKKKLNEMSEKKRLAARRKVSPEVQLEKPVL